MVEAGRSGNNGKSSLAVPKASGLAGRDIDASAKQEKSGRE
jgi:hypothetical protein